MIEHQRHARGAQDGSRLLQLVPLALDLNQPLHLAQPGEEARQAGLA